MSRSTNRGAFTRLALGALFSIAPAATASAANTITGNIAIDNFFAAYTGSLTGVTGSFASGSGPNINHSISVTTNDEFLYIAAWSDDAVQQGFLADLSINGMRVKSNDVEWLVFATGNDFDNLSSIPTIAQMNTAIAQANTASGAAASTSVGWVVPAVGGLNNATFPTGNPWPVQPGIGTDVRWVWYDSGLQGSGGTIPFRGGFNHKEYLIFRIHLCGNPCPGDLNGDGVVNGADLAALLGSWGPCPPVGGGGGGGSDDNTSEN